MDFATRYPEAVALKSILTTVVAEALVSIFARVGVPDEVLSDQGTQFTSALMKEVGRLLLMKQLTTTPYHPQCNGLVERFNATLKTMLKRMCSESPKDWNRYIDALLFAYREAHQKSLGFAPFEMPYGRSVKGPLQILRQFWTREQSDPEVRTTYQYVVDLRNRLEETWYMAHEELKKHQVIQKRQFDYRANDRTFKHGDLVLILLPTSEKKLLMQWKDLITASNWNASRKSSTPICSKGIFQLILKILKLLQNQPNQLSLGKCQNQLRVKARQ